MSTFCCPNCQEQSLLALPQNHYFRCTKCCREWFILEWREEDDCLNDLAGENAITAIFGPEVDAIVKEFLDDKGVSL